MQAQSDHERFLEGLQASEAGRWLVAKWLMTKGYTVSLKPIRYAPERKDWKEFADEGDLAVVMRVEAKQLSCDFTSREDWPFGENFIVCARHSFDNAQPRPYCYVILNRAGTHAAFVLGSSHESWKVKTRTDSRYNSNTQEFYFAPLEAVTFAKL